MSAKDVNSILCQFFFLSIRVVYILSLFIYSRWTNTPVSTVIMSVFLLNSQQLMHYCALFLLCMTQRHLLWLKKHLYGGTLGITWLTVNCKLIHIYSGTSKTACLDFYSKVSTHISVLYQQDYFCTRNRYKSETRLIKYQSDSFR